MNSHLRRSELCPIHHSFFCCGREKQRHFKQKISGPVIRVIDDHHPRGYREICSKQELRRRKHELIAKGEHCIYCPEPFTDYRQIVLAHKEPKGMGGANHDDHRDNLALAHDICNLRNGSKRLA